MRSKTQEDITLYLTQLGYDPDTTYLRYEGDGSVTVETPEGSQKLTVNEYEDIMEIQPDGSKRVIAESDLPQGHSCGLRSSVQSVSELWSRYPEYGSDSV